MLGHDQMCVGAAEAEAGDGRQARPVGRRGPRPVLRGDLQRGLGEPEVLARPAETELSGKRLRAHAEQVLDERDGAGGPAGVPDQRFVGGDRGGAARSVVLAQGGELREVTGRRAGRVRVHPPHVPLLERGCPAGPAVGAGAGRPAQGEGLARGAGRVDRLAPAVRGGAERAQHSEHAIAVRPRPAQALQDDQGRAVGEDHAVGVLVQRVDPTAPGQALELGEEHGAAGREGERAAADGDVVLARQQSLGRDVHRVERGGAGRVHHVQFRVLGQQARHGQFPDAVGQEAGRVLCPAPVPAGERVPYPGAQRVPFAGGQGQAVDDVGGQAADAAQHARLFEVLAAVGGVADDERVPVAFRTAHAGQRLHQAVAQPLRGELRFAGVPGRAADGAGLGHEAGDERAVVGVGLVLRLGVLGEEVLHSPAVPGHAHEEFRAGEA